MIWAICGCSSPQYRDARYASRDSLLIISRSLWDQVCVWPLHPEVQGPRSEDVLENWWPPMLCSYKLALILCVDLISQKLFQSYQIEII